jgi:hypothetical protein
MAGERHNTSLSRWRGRGITCLLALVLLTGCDGEVGRSPPLQKGAHRGPVDPGISAETRQALALRIQGQRDPVGLHQPLNPASLPAEGADATVDGRIATQRF